MITFTNTERKIINLNTGNEYGGIYDPAISTMENVIGEKKRLEFEYTTDAPIPGYNFYVNIALFMPKNAIINFSGKGSIYWECAIPGDASFAPGNYECNLSGTSSIYNLEKFRNYSVSIEIIDAYTFKIIAEFWQTYDVLGYLNSSMQLENGSRFLKDKYNNVYEETVSGQSIYNGTTHDGRVYLYAEYQGDTSDYGSVETSFGGYTANFYGESSAGIELNSITYKTTGSVPQEIDGLSSVVNTTVEISLKSGSFAPKVYVTAFKLNTNNNTIDFVDNYQIETALIDPLTTDQDLLIQPFVAPFTGDGTNYTMSFTVDKDAVDVGDEFGFAIIVYDSAGTTTTGILKKTAPTTSQVPFYGAGFVVGGFIRDYLTEFVNNDVECVVEERMASKIIIDFAGDLYKNDMLNRLGINVANDVLQFMTKVNFSIYEDTTGAVSPYSPNSDIRNYLVERQMNRELGSKLIFSGITEEFIAASYPNQLHLTALWRNDYNENQNCIRTLIDGVDYGTKLSTQDWSGKVLTLEWKLTFVYDTIAVPFSDVVTYKQIIRVKGYEPEVINIYLQDSNKENLNYQCKNANIDLRAEFITGGSTYKLISNIEPSPGSIVTIDESEQWQVGNFTAMPQKTTNKITDQETEFGDTLADNAKFSLNGDNLSNGVQYKISAIAKYIP